MTHDLSHPLVVVMGVSGSGKSTIGTRLAAELAVPFVDADALHPAANVAKMSAGTPLTDQDRWPWLDAVGQALRDARPTGIVIACSALKRAYRDAIRAVAPETLFLHLDGSRDVLLDHLHGRTGHFMPPSLLDSQLSDLQPLGDDERGKVIGIDAPIPEVVRAAVHAASAA